MSSQPGLHELVVPISERDHTLGPLDARLSLVEYGDYECPFCGMAYPLTQEIERLYGDQLCFVFRHFPIAAAHPHALHAAEAAEAAAAQGKFWEMHDRLYKHQDALEIEMLLYHAVQIGLDAKRLAADLAGHVHLDRIREDVSSGARSGVNGTPTFFTNGIRHDGPTDIRSLMAALELTAPVRNAASRQSD
jgi:protein-disulfide isomerase